MVNISHNQFIVLFHRKHNMLCLSAHAFAASHPLLFFVVMVVFAITTISVHLPVLVRIYRAIALSTFIGVLPDKDLHNANSTVNLLPPFSSPQTLPSTRKSRSQYIPCASKAVSPRLIMSQPQRPLTQSVVSSRPSNLVSAPRSLI